MELRVKLDFSSAHFLRNYQGSCERLHGHNYWVECSVFANKLDETGFVMDFRAIKAILKPLILRLDHQCLNELAPFDKINPTAENIAIHLAQELSKELPAYIQVHSMAIWETDGCCAIYHPKN